MGDYQLVYTAIGAIIFVTAIVGGRFFVVSNFVNADIESQTTSRELNVMSLSYLVRDCMRDGGTSIDLYFLDENDGKNLCEMCGICSIIGNAKMTDMESDSLNEWDFEYSVFRGAARYLEEKYAIWKGQERYRKSFSLYVNIDYGEYSHIGRLDVDA